MDDTANLSPLIFSNIQGAYINQLTQAFTDISHYAVELFYLLAAIELAFFGIIWALKQQEMIGPFLIKIIKLGFIFFLISNYSYLLQVLIGGFVSGAIPNIDPKTASYLFNPDKLLSFGFDNSMALLQLAVQYGTTNIGVTIIYLILGFGLLMMFALIATQVLILVIGFYVLALLALLLLPFGTLSVTQNLAYQSLRGVVQMSARLFAFILILGIGISFWGNLNIPTFSQSTTIDQPLGLFFATMVITILCFIIPYFSGRAIGSFSNNIWGSDTNTTNVNVTTPAPTAISTPGLAQVASATNMASQINLATQVTANINAIGAASTMVPNVGSMGVNEGTSELSRAIKLQRQEGISRDTLNKLKNTFREVVKQK